MTIAYVFLDVSHLQLAGIVFKLVITVLQSINCSSDCRASASEAVDSSLVLSRDNSIMTLKLVFTASLLNAQY